MAVEPATYKGEGYGAAPSAVPPPATDAGDLELSSVAEIAERALLGEVSESVERILAAARDELGMDVAYVTEFVGEAQVVRITNGAAELFGIEPGLTVPLAGSYCQRVMDGRLAPVVPDTAAEPEVRDLPVTAEAGLGAYVGVPVRFPDGELYGTLCSASRSSRPELAERDIGFMHVLARVIADTVERVRAEQRRRGRLEQAVIERTTALRSSVAGLARSDAEMVRRLARAVEYRDDDTGAHVHRVSRYSAMLAPLAGLAAEQSELIRHASPLHDVGKVAIPDAILLKPGRLTDEERAVMQTHAQVGYDLLKDSGAAVLQTAATIALTHHEKYDGSGYPRGLAGEDIPIEGRIVAILDVYDALSSNRVYRPAFPKAVVEEMMRADSGTHFDPRLLDLFLDSVVRIDSVPPPVAGAEQDGTLELQPAYAAAIERADGPEAQRLVRAALADGVPALDVLTQVVTPALRRIGDLWETDEITVADEHLATAITEGVLAILYPALAASAPLSRERILMACVEGDQHVMGLRMVADVLEGQGFEVIFLGADLPLPALLEAVEKHRPDAVALGATAPWSGVALERAVAELRGQHPELPLLLGGPSVPDRLVADDPRITVARSATEVVPSLVEALGVA